jgi:hypothetical protein
MWFPSRDSVRHPGDTDVLRGNEVHDESRSHTRRRWSLLARSLVRLETHSMLRAYDVYDESKTRSAAEEVVIADVVSLTRFDEAPPKTRMS